MIWLWETTGSYILLALSFVFVESEFHSILEPVFRLLLLFKGAVVCEVENVNVWRADRGNVILSSPYSCSKYVGLMTRESYAILTALRNGRSLHRLSTHWHYTTKKKYWDIK